MNANTVKKLSTALEAISDQFTAIENGKSEKWIGDVMDKIQDARIALLLELPERSTEAESTIIPFFNLHTGKVIFICSSPAPPISRGQSH